MTHASTARPALRRRRLRNGLRVGALLAAAGLVAAGCTSEGARGDGGLALPGITESSVKVGYVVADSGSLQKSLGLNQADYGTVEQITKGIEALAAWVNANGGAGGRTMEPVVQSYLASSSSPETVQQVCAALTQDDAVFAAVLNGQFQSNTLPCYYGANTLMIDQTVIAHDQTQFEQYRNYLWSPTQPEYGSLLLAQLDTLMAQGFFEGDVSVMLLTSGDEVSRRVSKNVAEPWLAANGITKVMVDYVDSTNQGTLGQTSSQALLHGKSSGANRVVAVGGARILPVALADHNAVDFESRWAVSTMDNPAFIQDNPQTLVTERRVGMVGIGYNPSSDVSTDKGPAWPDTTNPAEQLCMDIVNQAGATPPEGLTVRENWRLMFSLCDATMLLKHALDDVGRTGEVTAAQFGEGVASLGTSFRSASGFAPSTWGPGIYAGTDTARPLAWSEECVCFDYVGTDVRLAPPQAVGSATAAVTPAGPASPLSPVSPAPSP
jgi:hypothetical protein